jgi:hypothetical protein
MPSSHHTYDEQHRCIWGLLWPDIADDFLYAFAAAVAMYFVLSLYYGFAVSKPFQKYLAMDKGVKNVSGIKSRYGMPLCSLASFASCFIKAGAIIGIATLLKADSCCMYMQIAGVVNLISLSTIHNSVWEQRPMPLTLIAQVGEAIILQVAAVTILALKH